MIYSQLPSWNIKNQRVFLRADLNVPLHDGKISSDFRLKSIQPTLDFLINHNASIVLATHIGRPKNKDPELSTQLLIPWFKEQGYLIRFAEDFSDIKRTPIIPKEVILLENLRFFPGEKNADPLFAQQLAHTAQYYVNDAFGALHDNDCSIALLPYKFAENRRSIGFLIEKELRALDIIKNNPPHPFVAILGGGKIEDKIPLISHLIKKVDILALCPALCFTFLKALHQPIGQSLVADSMIDTCKKIIHQAESAHVEFIFPIDYLVSYGSIDGQLSTVQADQFPDNAIGISIGPKSIEQLRRIINQAQTIFLNCAMGFAEKPDTCQSAAQIISAIAESSAYTVIAGGDSVDTACGMQDYSRISHLSTGGGASLAYLSDKLLPGLAPFEE
jgi:phosphoglycerate kinase